MCLEGITLSYVTVSKLNLERYYIEGPFLAKAFTDFLFHGDKKAVWRTSCIQEVCPKTLGFGHWVFCRWGLNGPRNEGEPCSILWGKKRPARFLSRRLGQYILGVQLSAFPQGLKSQGDQMGLNEPSTLWSSWGWGPAPSLRTRAVPCAADPCFLFYKANIKRS